MSDGLGTTTGVMEVLTAVGLVIGLRRLPLGIAAATGLVALMVGAVIYHLRAADWAGLGGPIILGLLAAAAVHTARRNLTRRLRRT